MTIEELQLLISGDIQTAAEGLKKLKLSDDLTLTAIGNQYEPDKHKVKIDKTSNGRPDKQVKTTVDGKEQDVTIAVSRIPVPLQKTIVKRAAAFLCGNPIVLDASPEPGSPKKPSLQEQMLAVLTKIWEDNKLDFKSKTLAKLMMAETECAELWYTEDASPEHWEGTAIAGAKFKPRMRILANSLGDSLYPVFDSFGDMIAFGRGYKIKEGDKEIEYLDFYTAETRYMFVNAGTWVMTSEVNPSGKIPIIYYSQPQAEWADVQDMIDRLETLLSNLADTNDYFGDPMLVVQGTIKSLPKKTEGGKVLEVTGSEKAPSYLTWDQAPESKKLEIEYLLKFIYSQTQTPDISFENLKGIGQTSGKAWSFLFQDAHMKAADKVEIFGEAIQRRLNFLKAVIVFIAPKIKAAVGLVVKPKFEFYAPPDFEEVIGTIGSAIQYGIMSKETGTRQNPLLENAETELELIAATKTDEQINEPEL